MIINVDSWYTIVLGKNWVWQIMVIVKITYDKRRGVNKIVPNCHPLYMNVYMVLNPT